MTTGQCVLLYLAAVVACWRISVATGRRNAGRRP